MDYIDQQLSRYAPIAGNPTPSAYSPLEGVPGMSNPLIGMLGGGLLQKTMSAFNMSPMGMHDRNILDTIRSKQFNDEKQKMLSQVAENEKSNYIRTIKGAYSMVGVPFGVEQRQSAETVSGLISSVAPILSQAAPDVLDAMGGSRGSATVLASKMFDSGRYRMDPITGEIGTSADSVSGMSRQIYRDLYETGDPREMQGISAGQLGDMYQQMQSRGMIGAGPSGRASARNIVDNMRTFSPQKLREVALSQGMDPSRVTDPNKTLSGGDLDKLMENDDISDRMQSVDVSKVKRSLKGYTKAIAAIRDVFGDAGRPNAPMQELFAGLEMLSGSSIGQVDPERLASSARQTGDLARMTGVSLNQAMQLQGNAAAVAQRAGLETPFAQQIGNGSLAFMGAYNAAGGSEYAAWNKFSSDEVRQADQVLRANATNSKDANQAGAAIRLSEAVGGFEENSTAGNLIEALTTGQTEFVDEAGDVRSVAMSSGAMRDILTSARNREGKSANLDPRLIEIFKNQKSDNRESLYKYEVGDLFRKTQGSRDLAPVLELNAQQTLQERLQAAGLSSEDARKGAEEVSGSIADKLLKFDSRQTSSGVFEKEVSAMMQKEVMSSSVGSKLASALQSSGQKATSVFDVAAESFQGNTNRYIEKDPKLASFKNVTNAITLAGEEFFEGQDKFKLQAKTDGMLADSLSSIRTGSLLRNTIDAVMEVDASDPDALTKAVSKSLGGVASDDIELAVTNATKKMKRLESRYRDKQKTLMNATDSKEKKQLMSELTDLSSAYGGQVDRLANIDKTLGFEDRGIEKREYSVANNADSKLKLLNDDLEAAQPWIGSFDYEAFWDSEKGDMYKEAANDVLNNNEIIATKMLDSPAAARKYGLPGLKAAKRMLDNQEQIKSLAEIHTDGDTGRLLAGDFEDPGGVRDEILDKLNEQNYLRTTLERRGDMPGRQWGNLDTMKDALAAEGENFTVDQLEAASQLSDYDRVRLSALSDKDKELNVELSRYGDDLPEIKQDLRDGRLDRFKAQGLDDSEIDEMAAKLQDIDDEKQTLSSSKFTADQRIEAMETLKSVEVLSEAFQEEIYSSPADMVKSAERAFNITLDESQKSDLISELGSGEKAGELRRVIDSRNKIQEAAETLYGEDDSQGNEGVDRLREQLSRSDSSTFWSTTEGRETVQKKLGLDSKGMKELLIASDLYEVSGYADAAERGMDGAGTGKAAGDSLIEAVRGIDSQDAKMQSSDGTQTVTIANDKLALTGTLTLEGDLQAEATPGGRDDIRGTN